MAHAQVQSQVPRRRHSSWYEQVPMNCAKVVVVVAKLHRSQLPEAPAGNRKSVTTVQSGKGEGPRALLSVSGDLDPPEIPTPPPGVLFRAGRSGCREKVQV